MCLSLSAPWQDFYARLPWMRDGQELWEGVAPLKPTILTGLPRGGWAHAQKVEWCRRELGSDVSVITCFAADKFRCVFCPPEGT